MASQARMGQSSPSFDTKKIFPSPDYRDLIVVEVLSRKLENYTEVVYGTAHPSVALFPNHRLVLQIEQSVEDVVRYYAADRIDEDPDNYGISYSQESTAHPIYTRDYIVRRSAYAALTKLTALAGLIKAVVTAGGTGYTQETTTASLSGGTGSGGIVTPIVSDGAVIGLVVSTPGTYTVAPTVTINSTGGGAGATGTVAVQPQAALLVKEDMAAKTGDERIDSFYVLVRRFYEALPGPWIPFTRYDDQLGPIQGRRRAVANTGQAASLTGLVKTSYEARDGSSIVSWELEESPVSLPGPLLTDDPGYEQDTRTGMHTTRQVVAAGTAVPALSTSGTTDLIIDAQYQAINAAYGTMVITYLDAMPASRTDAESIGFQFPGLFEFIADWLIPPICTISGPYAGVNFTLTPPRSASKAAEVTFSYEFGTPTLPDVWIVSSPGAASRLFPIGQNTIHNAISITEGCSSGPYGPGTQLVEDLPASDPTSYTPGDTLTIRASYRKNWRGLITEKRITTIEE